MITVIKLRRVSVYVCMFLFLYFQNVFNISKKNENEKD